MNDEINYGENNINELGNISMNMVCTSLDGKKWSNLTEAMEYNEAYCNKIVNELDKVYNEIITQEKLNKIEPNQIEETQISTNNIIDNKNKQIMPFKSLDGKDWASIDQAMKYNKLYYEKMKIKDNLILDSDKNGFGTK